MPPKEHLSGIDLVEKIVEYNCHGKYVSTSDVYLEQIMSLAQALGLGDLSLEELIDGRFISENEKAMQAIIDLAPNYGLDSGIERYNTKHAGGNVRHAYKCLMQYKIKLYEARHVTSSYLEGGIGVILVWKITMQNEEFFKEKCKDVDDLLELSINPKGLKFTEKDLIDNYGYPVDNPLAYLDDY
ncbi:MAG TPA: hypothetical protein VK174_08720 [Chitinophagales bacterium]|nr:hypothetical protein [Chitinophagales bacterium]